ncbi:MAG TPA: fumarylacetoacetase [Candidatus Nanopelagicales bacterium]|jgi:fumarylacetoacetase|nr:fumarylacetoacetase [Candidatus Nanopelagicales bacterium]
MTGRSWFEVPDGSGFGVEHLPYAVLSWPDGPTAVVARIGEHALPLAEAPGMPAELFADPSLDRLLAAGAPAWARVRHQLTELLTDPGHESDVRPLLRPLAGARPQLAFTVADYVDFYSSEDHATNVGRIFRPDSDPLTPNWKHLPIGYHGRAGTVVVTGTDVVRPCGQRKAPADDAPSFGPSRRLDVEVEVGFVVGTGSQLGTAVAAGALTEHVFGAVLVNDWSARDIQAWEYVPLGPFLGKSFATSVSAWVTPLAALAGARVAPPPQHPPVLDYLRDEDPWALDLHLTLALARGGAAQTVSRPEFAGMYWTPGQQLAHLTVNGASLRTGDLYASGTVSGPEPGQRGSFLELSWGGTTPLVLADGAELTFLQDGDVVTIGATATGTAGRPITLGEVTGTIRPARTP